MRYSQIRNLDISNGEGIGMALFTQGCPFHCPNCFNPDTWDYDKGKEWTEETKQSFMELVKRPHIQRVTFLGGEPLLERNLQSLKELILEIKKERPSVLIWCYTGNVYEKIKDLEILDYIDILVDGPYIHSLRDLTLKFRGSKNQRVIDVRQTKETGIITLHTL